MTNLVWLALSQCCLSLIVPVLDGDTLLILSGSPFEPLVVANETEDLTAVKADGGLHTLNVVPQNLMLANTVTT